MRVELDLKMDGKNKTFVAPFISARKLRKTLEKNKTLQKSGLNEKDLDEMLDYVVDIFGKQFTRDELYDGVESNEIIQVITDCVNAVTGELHGKIVKLNGTEKGTEKNE